MAHNPEWHAEYARLELAHSIAQEACRVARRALDRKRPPVGAQAAYDAALAVVRETGTARFNCEMAATKIVDIATLPPEQFFAALFPNRS